MKINERIKARRKELGLTLKQVAEKLNVSESLISRYESNDVKNMGIDKIAPLAKVLKTTPSYLMGWEDKEQKPETLKKDLQLTTYEKEKLLKDIEKTGERADDHSPYYAYFARTDRRMCGSAECSTRIVQWGLGHGISAFGFRRE